MKKLATALLILVSVAVWGQSTVQTTDSFVVTGNIKKELKFSLDDIEKYPSHIIEDVVITNHLGIPRGTATELTGTLVKDLLQGLTLEEESPKRYSEFYLTFIAADNYKVVYSWNEIFNSPTGDNVFIIKSKDGMKLNDMDERILILTPTDFKTGRRHIKGLSKILVKRTN